MIQDILQDMSNDKCPCSFFRLGFVCDGHACETKEIQLTFCKKLVSDRWHLPFCSSPLATLSIVIISCVVVMYMFGAVNRELGNCIYNTWAHDKQQLSCFVSCFTVMIMVSVLSSVTINGNLRMVVIISYFSCLCYSRFCACF